ncbi:MAG: hypothetical protein ACREQ5_01600 [Candidatus Dormibacteria bacterium]
MSELTVPNNVPFLPGNDVVGIGNQLPAELVAAGYKNAIVFYSSSWNPHNTTLTTKFRFIATSTTGDLILGYADCANPSVNQTAIVHIGLDLQAAGIVAPNSIPFVAGNNVLGIGTTLPAELVAAGYVNAVLFYSSSWNPLNTTATIKYRFISTDTTGNLVAGYGICANPSVSQVPTINGGVVIGAFDVNGSTISFPYSNGITALSITELSGSALLQMSDPGNRTSILLEAQSGGAGFVEAGNATNTGYLTAGDCWLIGLPAIDLSMELLDSSLNPTISLIRDLGWTNIPTASLPGLWGTDAGRPIGYRLMPDGMVQFRGHITQTITPVNGETIVSALPSAYWPASQAWEVLAPMGDRAYNGTQAIRMNTDGTMVVFDSGTGTGDIVVDGMRYSTI